jgi:DNA-binding Xre family transcriptional regulator
MSRDPAPLSLANHITAKLAHLAAERSLSIAELATRAGLRPNAFSPVNGSTFDVDVLEAVANVLGVEAGEIVNERA